jgi:transcription termination factor NusB
MQNDFKQQMGHNKNQVVIITEAVDLNLDYTNQTKYNINAIL